MKLKEEEIIIVKEIIRGKSNWEIAAKMGYSVSSLQRKLAKLFKMLKVKNKTALAAAIVQIKDSKEILFG